MSPSNSSMRTDQEWVYALSGKMGKAEQEAAYDDLSKQLWRAAYNYLWKRQANLPTLKGFAQEEIAELARDFVQETLERLAHDGYFLLTKYSGKGRFVGWMIQILYNQIASELRRPYWSRRQWVPNDSHIDPNDKETSNPETAIIISQVNQILLGCLHKLSPRYREAVVRCIMEDEPADLLAAEMNISANAVYLLVHRAKQNLRKCVMKSGLDSSIFGIF